MPLFKRVFCFVSAANCYSRLVGGRGLTEKINEKHNFIVNDHIK